MTERQPAPAVCPRPPAGELPEVAVLLATFNGMKYLPEQLDTILGQQDVTVRVVASDDGSTDGTLGLLRARAAVDGRLVVLPRARGGSAAANFYRLLLDAPLTGAHYVAFSDQDDHWRPDKLARAVRRLRTTGAQGYSSDVLAVYPDGRRRPVVKSQAQRRWDHLFSSAGPGCTYVLDVRHVLALRHRLEEAGDLAAQVEYHDWLVYAWFRQQGLTWVIDAWPSLEYRQHGENVLGANAGVGAVWGRAKETMGGGPLLQVLALADFVGAQDEAPVVLLRSGRRRDLLRLAGMTNRLRRTRSAALGLAAVLGARSVMPRLVRAGP